MTILQKSAPAVTSWGRVLAPLAGLGLLALLLSALHPLGTLGWLSRTPTMAVSEPFLRQAAFYAFALVLVHVGMGVLCVGLCWLTERASPAAASQRRAIALLWFIGLMIWILIANAAWYPWSLTGQYYHEVVTHPLGPSNVYEMATITLVSAVVCCFTVAAARWMFGAPPALRRISVPAVLVAAGLIAWGGARNPLRAELDPANSKPHVVLIGVDALRTDLLRAFGREQLTPNLDEAAAQGLLFRDTVTPLARTFPAWISILSGKHPRTTGARFNLLDRDVVDASPTLADRLEVLGYRTVFATDEVRFSNINEYYGFDKAITPPIGVGDFLIGTVNDLPLPNVLANTRLARWLFPHTHANRAAAITYRPETFIRRLETEIDFDRPTLLALHLTAPHWPYYVAETPPPPDSGGLQTQAGKRALYEESVKVADAQVGAVVALLRDRGVLRNAIVFFLSDHGEGWCQPEDGLIDASEGSVFAQKVTVTTCGHGTSVLSPPQYQVLLAVRGYGPWASRIATGESRVPASLEDVTPTVLDLLSQPHDPSFDGASLANVLRQGDESGSSVALEQRFRFSETGLNLPEILAGEINVRQLAREASGNYTVDPDNGWVEIRPELLPEFLALKERAVIRGQWLLAAQPTNGDATRYVIADRRTGEGRILDRVPDAGADPIGFALWQALQARFAGELTEPAG